MMAVDLGRFISYLKNFTQVVIYSCLFIFGKYLLIKKTYSQLGSRMAFKLYLELQDLY